MPSFPTAPKSFATKNTGDVIQPADVNDLQDEVNAIEAGYLQGTAPLNSSNSTVVHLSATAGMNIVGNSTLGSTITIGGIPYQFPSTAPSSGQIMVCASTGTPNVMSWRSVGSAMSLVTTSDSESTTTSSVAGTLKQITGLAIAAASLVKVTWSYRKSSNASADAMLMRVLINGQLHVGATTVLSNSTAAVTGFGSLEIGPRDANNPATVFGTTAGNAGGNQNIQLLTVAGASTVVATISSITLDGYNLNGLAEVRIGNVKVWEITGA